MANLTGLRSSFPNSTDAIRELTDIPASKKPQAQRYQELKTKSVLSPAEVSELNSLTTELQDYLITAEYLNKFGDVVISTQKFFKENVMDFVLDKKQEFQDEVDKLNNKGDYTPSTPYSKNNFVYYDDGSGINHIYLCLKDCTGKTPSTNPTFWRKLTIQGSQGLRGEAGLNFVFQGVWNPATIYAKDAAVRYSGSLYVSNISGNVANEPIIGEDTEFWIRAMDISTVTTELKGMRTIVTETNTVNFMTGSINSFNPSTDSLDVYMNTTRLTEGRHYTLNPNNQAINKMEGTWLGSVSEPIFFEFVVTKNMLNNLTFKDGSAIADGTITRNKLDVDTQAEINKVGSISTKVGNGALTTTAQDIVGAINEHEGDISSINSQLAEIASDVSEGLANYNQFASAKDTNGIYTVSEFKRVDNTLYMKSTLSNADTNGNYQTMTWQFYETDGTTVTDTKVWTITYDVDGNVVSKVVN